MLEKLSSEENIFKSPEHCRKGCQTYNRKPDDEFECLYCMSLGNIDKDEIREIVRKNQAKRDQGYKHIKGEWVKI